MADRIVPDKKAPAFALQDAADDEVKSSGLSGKQLVLYLDPRRDPSVPIAYREPT